MLRLAQRAARPIVTNIGQQQSHMNMKSSTTMLVAPNWALYNNYLNNNSNMSIIQQRFFATPPTVAAAETVAANSSDTATSANNDQTTTARRSTDPVPPSYPKGLQDIDPNAKTVSSQVKKFLIILIFNPFFLGYGAVMYNSHRTKMNGEEDERNAQQASPFIAQTRQARRDSLSSFKEHVWQTDDPKKEYDPVTWGRFNYTTVVKSNSFKPGSKPEEEAGENPTKFMRKNSKTGLYDSDGMSGDSSRASSGIAAYRNAAKEEIVEKRMAEGEGDLIR